MQYRFAANDLGFHIDDLRVNPGRAAAFREIGMHLHALPQHAGFVGQQQRMHFMAASCQRRCQVLELTGKILMKKKNLQLSAARPQVMRCSKPSRLTSTCQTTAARCKAIKAMNVKANSS